MTDIPGVGAMTLPVHRKAGAEPANPLIRWVILMWVLKSLAPDHLMCTTGLLEKEPQAIPSPWGRFHVDTYICLDESPSAHGGLGVPEIFPCERVWSLQQWRWLIFWGGSRKTHIFKTSFWREVDGGSSLGLKAYEWHCRGIISNFKGIMFGGKKHLLFQGA